MILREVMSHEYVGACRYTGYEHKSIRFVLSCNHEVCRKASDGVPRRMKCYECERQLALPLDYSQSERAAEERGDERDRAYPVNTRECQ